MRLFAVVMNEIPRAQIIFALGAVTVVVISTLGVLSFLDSKNDAVNLAALERDPISWQVLQQEVPALSNAVLPSDCPIFDERSGELKNTVSVSPAISFICLDSEAGTPLVRAAFDGFVIAAASQPPLNAYKAALIANGNDDIWLRAATYGNYVVIAHASDSGEALFSIYANLVGLAEGIGVGSSVVASQPIATAAGSQSEGEQIASLLRFEVISGNTRFDTEAVVAQPTNQRDSKTVIGTHISDESWELLHSSLTAPFDLVLTTASQNHQSAASLTDNSGETDATADETQPANQQLQNTSPILLDGNPDCVFEPANATEAVALPTKAAFAQLWCHSATAVVIGHDAQVLFSQKALQAINPAAGIGEASFWSDIASMGNLVVVEYHLGEGEDRLLGIFAGLDSIDPFVLNGAQLKAGSPIGTVAVGTAASSSTQSSDSFASNEADFSDDFYWMMSLNGVYFDAHTVRGSQGDDSQSDSLYQSLLCNMQAVSCP